MVLNILHPGLAGGGGLKWNNNEEWVAGYARCLGITSGAMAELWVLKDGLILATQLRINSICVKLDAELIV